MHRPTNLRLCAAPLLALALFATPSAFAASGKIAQLCAQALKDKGYASARIESATSVVSAVGVSYAGQFRQGKQRYEFNCVINKQHTLEDLVVNELKR